MIRISEDVWIGNSGDVYGTELWNAIGLGSDLQVTAILNVAQDLRGVVGWPDLEYMQVGLVDGPGNAPAAYCAAVLALATLVRRKHRVLICCHTGSRSLAVAMMHMNLSAGRTWDGLLDVVRERVDVELPVPHVAHKAAFGKMNWRVLASVVSSEG